MLCDIHPKESSQTKNNFQLAIVYSHPWLNESFPQHVFLSSGDLREEDKIFYYTRPFFFLLEGRGIHQIFNSWIQCNFNVYNIGLNFGIPDSRKFVDIGNAIQNNSSYFKSVIHQTIRHKILSKTINNKWTQGTEC